jgi:hypothetical protein
MGFVRIFTILLLGALAGGLSGCVQTYRFEQSRVVNSSLSTDGTTSYTSHAEGEARKWCGPWVTPPDTIHP